MGILCVIFIHGLVQGFLNCGTQTPGGTQDISEEYTGKCEMADLISYYNNRNWHLRG